jgi:hypothetical protein
VSLILGLERLWLRHQSDADGDVCGAVLSTRQP